ncbi:MAG: hypothetical protein HYX69_01235 [Planctomycetia bacterium]|nr:hypothetical protein [Planctomycetia bacterium]
MSESKEPDAGDRGLEEQLVSYLDGELDADESSRVEQAMAADPGVRQELRQLEHCWHLLDELPRTEVDESFARSTVEMIAVKAEEDLETRQAELPRRRRRAWLVAGGSIAAAALVGYFAVSGLSNRTNDELLRDLPVIENLEQYRQVDDIEFLRKLKDRGFLDAEGDHDR